MAAEGGATAEGREAFHVVFVCSGNRFRSPLAEAAFRRAADGLPVLVTSCGTLDLAPGPAMDEAVAEATLLGLDLSGHESAYIDGRRIEGADLVLGFERKHAAAAIRLGYPGGRTFLLLELVLLLEGLGRLPEGPPAERASAAVAAAHRRRVEDTGFVTPPDLADPLGRPADYQRHVAERVDDLSRRLAAALFGPR